MTDRAQAFIVTLDDDYRIGDYGGYPSVVPDEESNMKLPTDADFIAHAIRAIKGVASVQPVVADLNAMVARERVGYDIEKRVLAALREARKG